MRTQTNYFTNVTNLEELRKEFKKLAFKHHPDLGGNTETMQEINNQYEKMFSELKDIHNKEVETDTTGNKKNMSEMPSDYVNAVMAIINIEGITIELCGSWLWISGNTFKHKETFKKANYNWSKSKKEWYWHPEELSTSFFRGKKSKDAIRKTWGSEIINTNKPKKLQTA